jgi:NifB/MoaA-like Fe-S oxidoreductase
MKTRLLIVAFLVLVAGVVLCPDIRSWENAEYTIKITGTEGTEFEGFCTHEVKYLIGSRTEATDLQGRMTADKNTFEFVIPGTEISYRITCKTLGKLITVTTVIDGIETEGLEGREFYFSG